MAGNQNPGYPNVVAGRAASGNTPTDIFMDPTAGALYTGLWVWNTSTLVWEKMTQPKTTDNAEVYGYNGTNWHEVRIDTSSRAQTMTGYPHHEAHDGNLYTAYRGDTLATNDTIVIAVTTPAGAEEQHIFWEMYSSGGVTIEILRDVTSYTGGTAFTPRQHNFRSNNTSNCTVKVGSNGALADGIVLTGGTEWLKRSHGAGRTSGGTTAHDDEHILEESEINGYRITAVSNGIVCDLSLTWYEHTPKAT